MKMTDETIKAIPTNGKLQRFPFLGCSGLYLQVAPVPGPMGDPRRSWVLRFRDPQTSKVVIWTIGEYRKGPTGVSIREAKKSALAAQELIHQGIDPRPEKSVPVPAPPEEAKPETPTVSVVVEDFYRLYVQVKCKPSTVDYQRWAIDRYIIPELGDMPITDVTLQIVTRILDKISLTAPVSANRVRSLLAKMFSWSLLRVEAMEGHPSPVAGSQRNPEGSRELRLTESEIIAVGQRYRESIDPRRHAAIFPLFTGCRIGIVLNIGLGTLSEDGKVLSFPAGAPGLKGCRRIYLSPIALELLPKIQTGLTLGQIRGVWEHLRGDTTKKSRGKGCRVSLHDLRRTFASVGVDDPLNHDESVVDALLGHSRGKIRDTYIRRADPTLVVVAESIGGYIGELLGLVEPKKGMTFSSASGRQVRPRPR